MLRFEKLINNADIGQVIFILNFLFFNFTCNEKVKSRDAFVLFILLIFAVNNGERSVWQFTLRDSEKDFINVTVWGSTEFVRKLSSTFNIGSVGEYFKNKLH